MEWISNAKLKQNLTEGTTFKLRGRTDICIHKIHGLGDALFLSCRLLSFESFDLKTEDFNFAVKIAKAVVQKRLEVFSKIYADFIEDESDNVFARY